MIVGKGIAELIFHPERGPGSIGRWRRRFQELGIVDQAEGAIVVLELIAVEVLVIAAGLAGGYGAVGLQKEVHFLHAGGQEEEQEQDYTPEQAICWMAQHFSGIAFS